MVVLKGKYKLAYLTSATLQSIAPWLILLSVLVLVGFKWQATPLQVGIVVTCFSGSMALSDLLGESLEKFSPKVSLTVFSIVQVISIYLISVSVHFWQIYILLIVTGLLIGCISAQMNRILKRIISENNDNLADEYDEEIFLLFRFLGPVIGSVLLFMLDVSYILLMPIFLYATALLPMFFISLGSRNVEKTTPNKQEVNEVSISYREIVNYIIKTPEIWIGFLLIISSSFIVSMADSQLVHLFRELKYQSGEVIGMVMGSSGVGVYIVNVWLRKKETTKNMNNMIIALFGLALIFIFIWLGLYYQFSQSFLYIILFFGGGIFWQLGMHSYMNQIEKVAQGALQERVMIIFGMLVLATYLLAPLLGGISVMSIGITTTFAICGISLTVVGCLIGLRNLLQKLNHQYQTK